jgi:hypothetical protein
VFPGKPAVNRPALTITIPQEWAGQRVRLVGEGDRNAVFGAFVNGRLVRRHHHVLHGHLDIDITEFVRFGESNQLVLARGGDQNGEPADPGRVETFQVDAIRLERFATP